MSIDLTEPLEVLTQNLTPALLGIGGVCAALAIVMAVMRWLMIDVDEPGQRHLKSRIMHVFGFIAGITIVSAGGAKLANSLMQNAMSKQITSSAGSSVLPGGVGSSSTTYSSLGDLIKDSTGPGTPDGTEELMQSAQEEADRRNTESSSSGGDSSGSGGGDGSSNSASGGGDNGWQTGEVLSEMISGYFYSHDQAAADKAGYDWRKIA